MKRILSIFGIAAVMAACTSTTDPRANETAALQAYKDSIRLAADTAGLAEFQNWKAQSEIANMEEEQTTQQYVAAAPVRRVSSPSRRTSSRSSSVSNRTSSGSGTSTSSNTAMRKKGWSKAAKGAVIGGVVGAGAGAVINKKNRAVGAVIGGVLGAGGGYGIGRGMDKRDGRY